LTKMF